jgi:hypothetical protein
VVFNIGHAETYYAVCKIEKKKIILIRDKHWIIKARFKVSHGIPWCKDIRVTVQNHINNRQNILSYNFAFLKYISAFINFCMILFSLAFCSGDVMWFLWSTNWISLLFCSGDVMWFLWRTNWISLSFCSHDVMWFLWGTNWISLSFCSGDVMWFLWGTNRISLSFYSVKTCLIVMPLRASVLVKYFLRVI